jgi:hypothetical protein
VTDFRGFGFCAGCEGFPVGLRGGARGQNLSPAHASVALTCSGISFLAPSGVPSRTFTTSAFVAPSPATVSLSEIFTEWTVLPTETLEHGHERVCQEEGVWYALDLNVLVLHLIPGPAGRLNSRGIDPATTSISAQTT